jgi:site-specific recombinase XerD
MDGAPARPYSSAYASIQFRALRQFFKWRAAEDDSPDPMTRLRAPKVTVTAVPVFTSGELSELDKACQGRSFAARRDAAIIAVLTATGIRLSQLTGICCHPGDPARSDLDLQARQIRIRGKGGTARTVKIGHQAARSLDRNQISSFRAPVERAIATLKTWRILFTDYKRPLGTFLSSFRAAIGLYFFKETFA